MNEATGLFEHRGKGEGKSVLFVNTICHEETE